MNFDPWNQQPIHRGQIWTSRCLDIEQSAFDTISDRLRWLGYHDQYGDRRHWQRHDKKMVLCPVDDIRSQTRGVIKDSPYLFDNHTTVITDNHINCPTMYNIAKLPRSFFGIYHNTPHGSWQPQRDFCFSVNRLDPTRFKLFCEMIRCADLDQAYVNFNCQTDFLDRADDGTISIDTARLRANFQQEWHDLADACRGRYQAHYHLWEQRMPYKNYTEDHDSIHLLSYCNIVVETYSGDDSVALSEKIFRALTLPVPWTVYSGRHTVAYLESLGFDCLHDLIDHNSYDRLKTVENKLEIFVRQCLAVVSCVKAGDWNIWQRRCKEAAEHNQSLLSSWRQLWPEDFRDWCDRELT